MNLLKISLIGVTLLLTACSKAVYTEKGLLEHPEKLKVAIQNCQKIDAEGNSDYCRMVFRASDIIRANLLLAMQSREAFGEKIIHLEMSVASNQEKLKQLKSDHNDHNQNHSSEITNIENELKNQVSEIKQLLAVRRLMGL
jgi:hypothetical protein